MPGHDPGGCFAGSGDFGKEGRILVFFLRLLDRKRRQGNKRTG
jgi:hypothetical protein